MTESFFSKIKYNKNKGPSTPRDHGTGFKFNHKQRLLQQASNSYQYAAQIEQQLQSKERNLDKYKKKFTLLKLENKELQSVIKTKDKDLLQKTKEIARLKEQIHSLKLHVLLFKKSSKKGVIAVQQGSSSTLQTVTWSSKSHQASDSHSELLPQLPFIHRKSSTQTSTLSACAVALQLPSPTPQALAIPNERNVLMTQTSPFQLSPISETNSRDEWNKSKKRNHNQQQPTSPSPSLLRHSHDNKDIDDLWGQCLADLCDDVEPTQKHTKQALAKMRSPLTPQQQGKSSKVSKAEDEIGADLEPITAENGADSDGELYSGFDSDGDVSYCTDNTLLMQELHMMSIEDDGDIITPPSQQRDADASDTSNSTVSSTPDSKSSPHSEHIITHQHFSKQSNDTLSGCDRIYAPISVFNFNKSIQIVLKDDTVVDPVQD